jgi:hypothetical protein
MNAKTGKLLISQKSLIADGSKKGKFYMLDRDHLGHFHPDSDNQIVQSFIAALDGIWGTPTYWDGPGGL